MAVWSVCDANKMVLYPHETPPHDTQNLTPNLLRYHPNFSPGRIVVKVG